MQNKLKFIEKLCGGNSLAHVLTALENKPDFEALDDVEIIKGFLQIGIIYQQVYDCSNQINFVWQLLKDNQEAKLQDQSEECQQALYKLLGGE